MSVSKSKRTKIRYTSSVHDHLLFVGVIVLAALLYATRLNDYFVRSNTIVIGLVLLTLLVLACLVMFIGRLQSQKKIMFSDSTQLDMMTGRSFERYIASLLPYQGFRRIRLTEYYDLGFDITAEKTDMKWGIQVKRHSNKVKMAAVQQAVAALKHYNCQKAMVITNSSFTKQAQRLAASNGCVLVDGHQLNHWIELSSRYK